MGRYSVFFDLDFNHFLNSLQFFTVPSRNWKEWHILWWSCDTVTVDTL